VIFFKTKQWKIAIFNGTTHYTLPFSIAKLLVITRGFFTYFSYTYWIPSAPGNIVDEKSVVDCMAAIKVPLT